MTTTTEQTTTLHIQIMEIVCDCCLVKMEELQARQKLSREACDARAIAMAHIKKYCPDITLKKIGEIFGGRDHSSILTALRKVDNLCYSDKDFRRMFNCS